MSGGGGGGRRPPPHDGGARTGPSSGCAGGLLVSFNFGSDRIGISQWFREGGPLGRSVAQNAPYMRPGAL